MNRQIAQGQWQQLKGKVREKWSKLTDDEVGQLDGKYETLVGKVQEKYGRAKEEAEHEVDQFLDSQDRGRDASRRDN